MPEDGMHGGWLGRGAQTTSQLVLLALTALLVGVVISVLTATQASVTVEDRGELTNVGFGWPIDFVRQDQSGYDPPLPYEMTLQWPRDAPTQVGFGMLVVNSMILGLPLAVIAAVALTRRRKREADGREHR